MLPDATQVDRSGVAQAGSASHGQDREGAPPVVGTLAALDEAGLNQAVDQAGQTTSAEADPLGELGHPQTSVGGHSELDEDVELGEGHVLLFDEFSLPLAQQGGLGIQKSRPGTQ